jgi:hypothetical protein
MTGQHHDGARTARGSPRNDAERAAGGFCFTKTEQPAHQPISPWAGLSVLAAWAAAALLTGGLLLRLRDA